MCIVHYRKNRLLCAECVICSNKNAFRERLKMAIDVDFWPDFEPFRLPSIHWTFSVSHCRISFCINISQTDRMLSCGYQTDCHRKWCMMRLTRDSLTDTTAGIHFDRYFSRATACNAPHGIAKAFLSVCLSVKRVHLTKRQKPVPTFLYHVKDYSS